MFVIYIYINIIYLIFKKNKGDGTNHRIGICVCIILAVLAPNLVTKLT